MKKTITVFLLLLLSVFTYGQDGTLDTGFDGDGIAEEATIDEGVALAIQSDGKIVVVGSQYNSDTDIAVVRFNTDGSLDTGFGTNGITVINLGTSGTSDDLPVDVVLQSDGKIVIAVKKGDNSGRKIIAVVRLTTNGSLDTSFGTNGVATTSISANEDLAEGIAIDGNGKIIVAGTTDNGSDYDIFVVRFNTDGTLDTSFDNDGKVTKDISAGSDNAKDVIIQSDNKIIVAGSAYFSSAGKTKVVVLKYKTDGSLDNGFDSDGIVSTSVSSGDAYSSAVTLDSDEKILVTGYCYNSSGYEDFFVLRYKSDGSLDTGFDADGIVETDLGGDLEEAYGITVASDGKIIVAGYTYQGSSGDDIAVVKYNTDGSLDTSFDTDGIVITDVSSGSNDDGYDVALDGNNKIVVAGTLDNALGALRYNNTVATPVELVSFAATTDGNEIALNWQTATEVNNYGFQVERQKAKGESSWEEIGFVEGAGNSNSPKAYSFTDNVTESGRYSYRLKQIDIDGSYEYSNVVEVNISSPDKFELMQNYPNPFNPTTTIKYSIPSVIARSEATKQSHDFASNVQLNVYNILGEEVATLVNEKQAPGNYTVQFNASNLPSGVYFYTLRVGDFVATKKMVLLK